MRAYRTKRVASQWLRKILAAYSPEFRQWVDRQMFRNPDTDKQVKFDSLPNDEKRRVHQRWMGLIGEQLIIPGTGIKSHEEFSEFSDGYEDWDREELNTYLSDNGIKPNTWPSEVNTEMVIFNHNGETYVAEDPGQGTPMSIATANQFMENVASAPDGVYQYIPRENFNQEFWESPVPLYHGTQKDHWKKIKQQGLEPRADSRGISNRGMSHAVFTSLDTSVPLEYGDVLIRIDTQAMKKDGFTPEANREDPLIEADATEALAHRIGLLEYYVDREHGLDPDTVALFSHIPAKYLKQV